MSVSRRGLFGLLAIAPVAVPALAKDALGTIRSEMHFASLNATFEEGGSTLRYVGGELIDLPHFDSLSIDARGADKSAIRRLSDAIEEQVRDVARSSAGVDDAIRDSVSPQCEWRQDEPCHCRDRYCVLTEYGVRQLCVEIPNRLKGAEIKRDGDAV